MATIELRRAIVRAFQQAAPIVRNYTIVNLSGKVLRQLTGRLAGSIRTQVAQMRDGGILWVGTRVNYGRYWERGFTHTGGRLGVGKFMKARPWLRPAALQAMPEIVQLVNREVERELQANFEKARTIEIKLTSR